VPAEMKATFSGGPRSAYAAALPPRPPMGVPYRTGRAIRR